MSGKLFAVTMPKWGLEMAEGTVSAWLVQEGDTLNANDDLVDIETSKIINTLTCSQPGTLVRIVAPVGSVLDVGSLLGVIATANTSTAEIDQFISTSANTGAVEIIDSVVPAHSGLTQNDPAQNSSTHVASSATYADNAEQPIKQFEPVAIATTVNSQIQEIAIPDSLIGHSDDSTVAVTPVARRLAKQHDINLSVLKGTGRNGRITLGDLKAAVVFAGGRFILPSTTAGNATAGSKSDDSAVAATPVARRLARQLGINLLDCRSSGRNHRVCKADVETAAARLAAFSTGNNAIAQTHNSVEPTVADTQPLTGIRRTIGNRLQASKSQAPHFRVCIDAELDHLLALRKQLNHSRSDVNISINDCMIKATAMALAEVPAVNIQFDGNNVTCMPHADISVAVALDDGLITPIITAAESKGLAAISKQMRDLSTRARLGKLKPEEFQGGSFSLSNLGMFGIKQFDAIINPPQAAILAIGAGAKQLLPAQDHSVRHATVITLTLSSDHRVIDGAVAAHFLQTLKTFIEQPATMLG